MTITIADVLAEIKRQLAIAQPNVVLSHEQAEYLYVRMIALLNELDILRAATEDFQRPPAVPSSETQHLGPDFHIEHDKGR